MINSKQYALSSMIARNTTAAVCLVKENSINLIQYMDEQRQTVIHQCVKLRNLDFLKFLSTYLPTIYTEEEIQTLLNKFNIEQFTALHVASYNGDIESVKVLLLMGAQASTRSGSGLYPIHTAAQGDQIIMIKFWIDQGYQINLLDSQLNSVLHWACFQNCEITVNFLIAWGIDLNARNQQGYTALHLACIQSANKIVRKLLIRGADRQILDNQNKTPLDMADDPKIQKMLIDATDCYVLCNLRQPFRVQKRSIQSILMFLTIFCSTNFYILELAFEEYFPFFVGQLFTTIFTLLTYATVCGSDPGYIDQCQVDIFKEDVAAELICPDCQIIKPRRSKHCEICQQCVIVYDHHCPWINNCIGAKYIYKYNRNFKIFFCFIFLTIVNFLTSIVIIIIFLIYSQLSMESLKLLYPSLVIGILIYPVGSLLYYQTQNLFKGLTTYERFNSQTQGMQKSVLIPDEQSVFESSTLGESVVSNDKYATLDQEMKSPIDNCLDMCFRNQYTYNQQ